MVTKVFVTGAAGYIGGSVAARLVSAGYEVHGLTRSQSNADKLESMGIKAVVGDLSDSALLTKCATETDAVIDAADADNAAAVKSLIAALAGSDKVFIHTSGSSIVADQANGESSEIILSETTQYKPHEHKQARVNIDKQVTDSAAQGIRSVVICPCMIYGKGLGTKAESTQIPMLIKQAMKSGVARCIGKGNNIWSTVHIEDLADLYLNVIEKKPQGGVFLFAENGEVTFKQLAEKIKESLDLKTGVEEWPIESAAAEWGFETSVFALGSNSRIRAERSRQLGWTPQHNSALEDVRRSCSNLLASARA